ncbi:MAG: hypothetical protein HY092_03525, partial [Candidatus Kerfeldbacteria bacterium]|nr:hypothetical protein [Candidatus Kerfeldbacteria bacterium]
MSPARGFAEQVQQETGIPVNKIFKTSLSVIFGLFVIWAVLNMFFILDGRKIAVVQYPNGTLSAIKQPGPHLKMLGHVELYQKQSQYWFSKKNDQGDKSNEAIKVRFNDGGHADMSGSISWNMPMDDKSIIDLHVRYGSQAGVEQRLVRTVVEKSVYMTGPLMSSRESYNERRNELIHDIEDQIQHGVYRTSTVEAKA